MGEHLVKMTIQSIVSREDDFLTALARTSAQQIIIAVAVDFVGGFGAANNAESDSDSTKGAPPI
jgi:hypothetical protein